MDKRITVKFPLIVYNEIKKLAKNNRRSFQQEIIFILEGLFKPANVLRDYIAFSNKKNG